MKLFRFESRITLVYLIAGIAWILLSDMLVEFIALQFNLNISTLQTAKGWFYVLINAGLLFIFIRNHLGQLRRTEAELEKHRSKLTDLVHEKTKELDQAIEQLKQINNTLSERNLIIDQQNKELLETINTLRTTQAQLAQADRMAAIGVLITGIVHEVNVPLRTLEHCLTHLTHESGLTEHTPASFSDQLEKGFTAINRISKIISGLNHLSSKETSLSETCDLHTILENCLAILSFSLKGRIHIHRRYTNEALMLKGNTGQLHQAIISILINAEQSITGEGEIEINTQLTDEGKLLLTIRDTGCGIEEQHLSHVTDPFFTTKEPGKGSGLGLSIAYTILKNHGGELDIQSKRNEGTTVTITLPQTNLEQ